MFLRGKKADDYKSNQILYKEKIYDIMLIGIEYKDSYLKSQMACYKSCCMLKINNIKGSFG